MKKQHITATILICLVIGGAIGVSACAPRASAEPKGGLEAYMNTAVAATLMQHMIETEVAVQSLALASAPAAQVQATAAPVSTPTPAPTASAQPSAAATLEAAQPTPTAPAPPTASPIPAFSLKITADQDTNCRVGPGTGYTIETYFLKGSESSVEGRDRSKDWWYIVNPHNSSEFCWVWDGSTTVKGDSSALPVVEAPTGPNLNANNLFYDSNAYNPYNPYGWGCYDIYGYNGCGNFPYNYCGWEANWRDHFTCKQNKWWTCNPYVICACQPVFQNPCRKSGCPALTEVNFKNYCTKYPKCCD